MDRTGEGLRGAVCGVLPATFCRDSRLATAG